MRSVLDGCNSWNLNWLVERDQMRGDGDGISTHRDITRLEPLFLRNLSSSPQRLNLAHEWPTVLSRIPDEVSDLFLVSEIVEQKCDVGHFLVDVLVIDRSNSDDGFAGNKQDGAAADQNTLIVLEISRHLGLLEGVFVSTYMHAD